MIIDLTTNKKKLPKGRKKRRQFKSNLYSSYKIPRELRDALIDCKKAQKKASYETILNDAFAELEPIWKKEKDKPVKETMRQCLVYNPPPGPKEKVLVSLRFNARFSYLIDAIIAEHLPLAKDTTDLIKRTLSWYLRKKGFLEQKK